MAEPIRTVIRPSADDGQTRRQEIEGSENLLAEYREELADVLDVVRVLHEKGLLRVVRDVVAAGEEILEILVNQIGSEGGKRLLKNVVSAGGLLAAVDLQGMAGTAKVVTDGLRQAAGAEQWNRRPPGIMDLLRAMRDPDVVVGLLMMLQGAKVLGMAVRRGTGDGRNPGAGSADDGHRGPGSSGAGA
ncbi:MAG: DUF1641 domain-containing protein [Kyrpidia sp.]|nr:DUF1641 domain-containing protein [Kyrpidia sp.]